MNFANFTLSVFLSVPLVWILYYYIYRARYKAYSSFASPIILNTIAPKYNNALRSAVFSALMLSLIFFALSFSLLRPQLGYEWKDVRRKGIDLVIAVDVSQSMLAQDLKPSRLERARRELIDLLSHLQGDRVALVTFAGSAYTEVPLTHDYSAIRLFLQSLSPDLISDQGTNVAAAIKTSLSAFSMGKTKLASKESSVLEKDRGRAILLLTDGEDFSTSLGDMKEELKRFQVQLYVIGIGTKDGAPIPLNGGNKKNSQGGIVISKLKPEALSQLAEDTGGKFVLSISSDADTKSIYHGGMKTSLEGEVSEGGRAKIWNEYYQTPLAIGILLMLIYFGKQHFSFAASAKAPSPITSAGVSRFTILLIALLFFSPFYSPNLALGQSAEHLGAKGKEKFFSGEFENALESFKLGKEKKPKDPRFFIGEGASNYRLNKFEEAEQSYISAFELSPDDLEKAKALYNAANSMVQRGKLEEAIKTYENSLILNKDDNDAINNLAYAKKLLELKRQQEQKQTNQNKQEQKSQEEQKQQESSAQDKTDQDSQSKEKDDQSAQSKDDHNEKGSSNEDSKEDIESMNGDKQNSENEGDVAKHPMPTDQLDSLLNSIEENKELFLKDRAEKARKLTKGSEYMSGEGKQFDW